MSIVEGLDENFEKYNIGEAKLCDDISNDKLTFYEALARCQDLWTLIPNDCDVNPVRLNNLMKEKFGELDEYKKHYKGKIYTIDIGTLKDEDVEIYVKKVMEQFKRPIMNVDYSNLAVDEEYFIPMSTTINDMEKFNNIMADAKQDNAAKHHAIDFAEWLWRTAIQRQRGGTYTVRESDGNIYSHTIEELYDMYLNKPMPTISKEELIKELSKTIPPKS